VPKVVLVVLSASNLDHREGGSLRSSKLHSYISEGHALGLTFKFALLREETVGLHRSEYAFLRLPFSAQFWSLSFLSFLFRSMGLIRPRKWVLEKKSMVQHSTWIRLLELVRANGVIGIGLPQELLAAAHLRRVPAIEVQHGSLDPKMLEQVGQDHL
jgi:hypothetical protein